MAAAMMPGMGAPEMAPAEPSMDQFAAFEQLREQVSPTEFNREMLSAAEQADPIAVAEFKRELAGLELAPEVIQMLDTMVEEVLGNPADYPAIRQKYLAMGVDEELLPEVFDAPMFAALNMAVDQMRGPETMMPPQGFAKGGIASLKPMAREMAAAGRYGDTMLAHISPMEAQMLRRYGGSGTINPTTGLPEFFLKKAFKSIGSAVKKFAGSTVGKIVIGTALFFLAGPAATAMFGSTAAPAVLAATKGFIAGAGTTLLGGGNLKEALKAGAVSGLAAGATTAAFKGADAFKAAPKAGTMAPGAGGMPGAEGAALPELSLQTPSALQVSPMEQQVQDALTGRTAPTAMSYTPPPFPAGAPAPAAAVPPTPGFMQNPFRETPLTGNVRQAMSPTPQPSAFSYTPPPFPQGAEGGIGSLPAGSAPAAQQAVAPETAKKGILDRVLPSRIREAGVPAAEQAYAETLERTGSESLAMKAYERALPGMSAYLPMAGLGIAALGAAGGFKAEPSQIPPGFEGMMGGQGATGIELLARYPQRFGLQLGPTQITSSMPYASPSRLFQAGAPQQYAEGGMTEREYPRKNGAINGPGTGTSDSIPAMLSDGEFVFTAKAVRAMGDGSRRKGAKRMYALMRKLEGRANG